MNASVVRSPTSGTSGTSGVGPIHGRAAPKVRPSETSISTGAGIANDAASERVLESSDTRRGQFYSPHMRAISFFAAALAMLVGCAADDSLGNPSTTGGSSGGNTAGNAGAAGSSNTTTATAAGGAAGSGGSTSAGNAGTAGTGTGTAGSGTGGSGGAGGGVASDSGADASAGSASDSSAPKSDVQHDVVADSPSKARQVARPIGMPYPKNGYWEYLPVGYGDGTPRPLLVFWHGIGENGAGTLADLAKVIVHGPPKLINLNQWTPDRPFVVLSPQHPGTDCPSAAELHDFFTFAMARYDVDPKRIYLTGLSCGARGGWAYLGQYKGEQVIAAALIAADSSVAFSAAGCTLLDTVGIWCFHGGNDNPAMDTAGMMNFMNCPMPRKDAKYTLYPGVDHQGSWERAYDDPVSMNAIVTWLLGQSK